MKRSDMLDKMVAVFRQCKIMRYSDDQAMDRVLEVCQENGMVAPYPTGAYNPEELEEGWEPENE